MTNQPNWIEAAAKELYPCIRDCGMCEGTGNDSLGDSEDKNVVCPFCRGSKRCLSQSKLAAIIAKHYAGKEAAEQAKYNAAVLSEQLLTKQVIDLQAKQAATARLVEAAEDAVNHLRTGTGCKDEVVASLQQAIDDVKK